MTQGADARSVIGSARVEVPMIECSSGCVPNWSPAHSGSALDAS